MAAAVEGHSGDERSAEGSDPAAGTVDPAAADPFRPDLAGGGAGDELRRQAAARGAAGERELVRGGRRRGREREAGRRRRDLRRR